MAEEKIQSSSAISTILLTEPTVETYFFVIQKLAIKKVGKQNLFKFVENQLRRVILVRVNLLKNKFFLNRLNIMR